MNVIFVTVLVLFDGRITLLNQTFSDNLYNLSSEVFIIMQKTVCDQVNVNLILYCYDQNYVTVKISVILLKLKIHSYGNLFQSFVLPFQINSIFNNTAFSSNSLGCRVVSFR